MKGMSKELRTGIRKRTSRSRELIDQNLRTVFHEMVEEELPDRLKALLDRLEKSDAEIGSTR